MDWRAWVCNRVLTTSRGLVTRAATAPAPAPERRRVAVEEEVLSPITSLSDSFTATITPWWGMFISNVVGYDTKKALRSGREGG